MWLLLEKLMMSLSNLSKKNEEKKQQTKKVKKYRNPFLDCILHGADTREKESKKILKRLLNPIKIKEQVPLVDLIPYEEYNFFNDEVQKHKFDLLIITETEKIIVEINYKHKEKAARKWRVIFTPTLERLGYKLLIINDYDCETLFKPQDYSKHKWSKQDDQDIINALELAQIPLK